MAFPTIFSFSRRFEYFSGPRDQSACSVSAAAVELARRRFRPPVALSFPVVTFYALTTHSCLCTRSTRALTEFRRHKVLHHREGYQVPERLIAVFTLTLEQTAERFEESETTGGFT